jgi:hypothetical protein
MGSFFCTYMEQIFQLSFSLHWPFELKYVFVMILFTVLLVERKDTKMKQIVAHFKLCIHMYICMYKSQRQSPFKLFESCHHQEDDGNTRCLCILANTIFPTLHTCKIFLTNMCKNIKKFVKNNPTEIMQIFISLI